MENKLGITKDGWYVDSERPLLIRKENGDWISQCFFTNYLNKEEAINNTNLFIDAGKTSNKCGKLPSELLEERTLLLEALETAIIGLEWGINDTPEKDHKADEEKIHEWKELIQSIEKE